ncbi:DUF1064 domain-containing protein [Acinetobacter baumannii]|uniref:DUF1064 domain-containing protein n=1 Tax=Acinetobacter baumannii TaxID=470 RepID=UPI0009A9B42E|nr:DUF1064 domain-containing protein [Acinetobacter baumannii]
MQERMTSKEYLKQYGKPSPSKKKSSKYKNIKTKRHGIIFDSEKEANRYDELLLLERCKLITNIRRQVRFNLYKNPVTIYADGSSKKSTVYVADFVYTDLKTGKDVIEDVKSEYTAKLPLYQMKKQAMKENLGLDIIEI